MFSLESIQKMNTKVEVFKQRRRARGLNCPGGHSKSAEKGLKKFNDEVRKLGIDPNDPPRRVDAFRILK